MFDAVAECYWREYRGAFDPTKIHIIPNGYEGELQTWSEPHRDKCTVLYTGTVQLGMTHSSRHWICSEGLTLS